MSRTGALAALSAMLLLGVMAASAQGTARPPLQTPYIFHATVGEVLVHATVVNKKGQPVINLPQSDFTVYEDGVQQKIDFFAHEDAPVSVGLLVDNSGSMRANRPEVDRAALNFVKASNPQDEAFVVNFNDQSYLDAPFTNSIPKLRDALDRIQSSGGTVLYDTIIASLDYMNNNAHNDKHVMLVITDGDDDESLDYTLEQTVRILQGKNVPLLYCIGILDKHDPMNKRDRRALQALAKATGGQAFFPKDLSQVNATTLALAQEIRAQYTLSYHSNQTGSGYRTIKLEVRDKHEKHLQVHSRSGYFDNSPKSASGAAGGH